MIVELGKKSRREAHRMFARAADALREGPRTLDAVVPRRYELAPHAQKIERERMRAKVDGTRSLATALEIALAATRRDVLHRLGMREAKDARDHDGRSVARLADHKGQIGFDSRHLEKAFKTPIAAAFRSGVESAKSELRAWPVREDAQKKRYTIDTAFDDFDPTATIDALYQTTLVFSRDVVDRERDALKRLLLDAVANGDTGAEINDAIRLFFEDGIHYIGDDGAIARTIPQDSWIDMVSRTEIARAQNGGITDTYRAAGVEQVQFVTAEDERVCPDCDALDGEIFDVGSDDTPPIHPSCRCTVIAHDEFSEQSW